MYILSQDPVDIDHYMTVETIIIIKMLDSVQYQYSSCDIKCSTIDFFFINV